MNLLQPNGAIVAPAAALGLFLLVACTDSDDKPDNGGGGTTTTTTVGGAGGSGGQSQGGSGGQSTACNQLTNDGPEVEALQVAQDMPAPTGGKLELGPYHLTAVTLYTGPGGATGPTGARQKERAQYGDGEVQVVADLYQGAGDQHFTLSFSLVEAADIAYQGTCPGPLSFPYDKFTFTAPDTLKLYSTQFQQELTYERTTE